MKGAFAALVGVQMLAELIDNQKLRDVLEGIPHVPHWRAVREIVEREILRRQQSGFRPTIGDKRLSDNAA